MECFHYGKVRIVKLYIFADYCDRRFFRSVFYSFDHVRPFGKVGGFCFYSEFAAYYIGKMVLFEHKRRFIENGDSHVFYYAVFFYIAEKSDLFEYRVFERLVTAKDYYIGAYAHALKLFYGVLRRF